MFYFSYVGSKSKDLKNFIKFIPDHIQHIIEPFCGACSVSRFLATKHEFHECCFHVDDNDNELIGFLQTIHSGHGPDIFRHAQQRVDNEKPKSFGHKSSSYFQHPTNSIDDYFYYRFYSNSKYHYIHRRKHENYDDFHITNNFFKNAHISCLDYTDVLNQYKNDATAFLFIDPPYLDSFNVCYKSFNQKTSNDNTRIFVDLVKYIKSCKCKVMIILNDNALVRYLFDGYIKSSYDKIYQFSKRKAVHLVITNY